MFIFLLIVLTSFKENFALLPEEDVEFIRYASRWRKGQEFAMEDCLFYNFGYVREFPYSMISLTLEEDLDIVINTHGMEVSTGCSIVLIAGKYVQQIDQVMKRIDEIVDSVQFVPLATFIFENSLYPTFHINANGIKR